MVLRLASVPTVDSARATVGQSGRRPAAANETVSEVAAAYSASRRERADRLVRAHLDFVWRLLRRLGLSVSAADDAAQQVFVIAARRIDDIESDSERSFLYGAALRVLQEYRRSQARRRETYDVGEPHDARPGPDELVELKRAAELLQSVLDEMTDDLRTAFVLFELEGMTTPEIAEVAGIPLGTAASRLRRAREQFTATLKRLRTPSTPR